MDPNFANRQILERTVKQKFIGAVDEMGFNLSDQSVKPACKSGFYMLYLNCNFILKKGIFL
jgi:hypothetical protein